MSRIFTVRTVVWIIAAALLAAAGLTVIGISRGYQGGSALSCQNTARVWQAESDDRMSMVSGFFDREASVSEIDVMSFRETLEKKLDEASVVNDTENSRLYIDCWAAKGEIYASTRRGSASLETFGVGGDFFIFHKLPVADGWYFSDDESGEYRVVLDETAAWQLFGGVNVSGLTVTINEVPYTVSGVVLAEDGIGYEKAYGTGPHMYMTYSAFSAVTADGTSGAPIISYEIVTPSPVTNFAYDMVSSGFGRMPPQAVYKENTGRYSALRLYKLMPEFFYRSMRSDMVVYPYWENTAVSAEDICTFLLLIQTALFGAAIIIAVVVLIIIIVRLRPMMRRLKDRAAEKIEDFTLSAGRKPDGS